MSAEKKMPRFWFYPPELYWFGWQTLIPVYFGGDEFGRPTVVLGWMFTGRIVIAIGEPSTLTYSDPDAQWLNPKLGDLIVLEEEQG